MLASCTPELGEAANVNVLNPEQRADVGESSSVHSVEVEIIPLDP